MHLRLCLLLFLLLSTDEICIVLTDLYFIQIEKALDKFGGFTKVKY